MLGKRFTNAQKNELYQHINRAYDHQVELFFAFSALLFGAQTTKQAYGRFKQGTDFTRANVVEFFRAGELQSVVSPMLNLLNFSLPRDMVPFVAKSQNCPETAFWVVYSRKDSSGSAISLTHLCCGPYKGKIEQFHKENRAIAYLSPSDHIAVLKKLAANGPRVNKADEQEIFTRSLSLPPSSLSALQAKYRETT